MKDPYGQRTRPGVTAGVVLGTVLIIGLLFGQSDSNPQPASGSQPN